MDKKAGIYQPLIEHLNMTALFKMISSLASGRAEGVAAQIDAIVELACALTTTDDQTPSTLQAASPIRTLSTLQTGDETTLQAAQIERRTRAIAAFSAWVRGFSRRMRREPVKPELITEMAEVLYDADEVKAEALVESRGPGESNGTTGSAGVEGFTDP